MNNNRGTTLVELIVAMVIILIASLGFFSWLSTVMRMNTSIERSNTAYAMANDIADRLQRMNNNSLIQHNTNRKCFGYNSSGNIGECRNPADSAVDCNAGDPNKTNSALSSGTTGMTRYTNPTQSSNTPYLYDNNACAGTGTTWVTAACRTGSTITPGSNTNIDHPNSTTGTPNYDSINPIRSYKGTTYYAVWSVAYMPCNAGTNTDRRKIFITVYWIDPEPAATTAASALNGATIKSVSLVVDKTIGAET